MASESDLASGIAQAHQSASAQFESSLRARIRKLFERGLGDQLRLIEAALRLLVRMQRHGHDGDKAGGQRRIESGNRIGEHASQNLGRWPNLAELQQMNQIAQSAVVAAVG